MKYESIWRDQWNNDNPIKTFSCNDGDCDSEQIKSWEYRSNKTKKLGMDIFTPKRTKKPKQSYNWQTALADFKRFLNNYTPKSDLLICQGYFKDNKNNNNDDITSIITNMCKRSMDSKPTTKELPFIDEYNFTNGVY